MADSIIDKLKQQFRQGSVLLKLIYINVAIFLLLRLTWVVLMLFNIDGYVILPFIEMPSIPYEFITHPWTLLTYMFVHYDVWHILFNMLTLWCVGPVLERMMGHWSFLALYAVSGLAGGTGMMLWAVLSGASGWITPVYGASGALFGLFAAILVVYRRIGLDIRSMMIWMLINFLMPVIMPNIAWQAHLGGFLFGGMFTWLLVSGLRILRGKSLPRRTLIYGTVMVIVIIAIDLLCNVVNPVNMALF